MRSRRASLSCSVALETPISDLNTTPLIDVLLVLLIMFIVTIPIATHKVRVDLPAPGSPAAPPVSHRLDIDSAGRIGWDGAPLAAAALPGRLSAFRAANPDGLLLLRTDGETRYEEFDRLLAVVKRSGIARLAFLGNERFAGTAIR